MSTADVVAWLRSPEGEEWSRSRALDRPPDRAEDDPAVYMQVLWRAAGPLDAGSDPCGRPPVRAARTPGAG